jgi:transcriptional regulator with XRE-family HTH domain
MPSSRILRQMVDGKQFRQARRAAGFKTQEALAEKVGCAIATIGRIERCEFLPGADLAGKLSKALRVPWESLLQEPGTATAPDEVVNELALMLARMDGENRDFCEALIRGLDNGGSLEAALEAARLFCNAMAARRTAETKHRAGA